MLLSIDGIRPAPSCAPLQKVSLNCWKGQHVLCLGALACACAGKVIKTRQTIENICTGHLLSQRHTIPRIRPAKHKHKHLWKVGVRRGQEEQHKSDRQQ